MRKRNVTPMYITLYAAVIQGALASGDYHLTNAVQRHEMISLAAIVAEEALEEIGANDEAEKNANSGV